METVTASIGVSGSARPVTRRSLHRAAQARASMRWPVATTPRAQSCFPNRKCPTCRRPKSHGKSRTRILRRARKNSAHVDGSQRPASRRRPLWTRRRSARDPPPCRADDAPAPRDVLQPEQRLPCAPPRASLAATTSFFAGSSSASESSPLAEAGEMGCSISSGGGVSSCASTFSGSNSLLANG